MDLPNKQTDRPVIVVPDYGKADGKRALQNEVAALSLGFKQQKELTELIADIWREKDGQLMAEEIPLTRVLDLAILAAQTSLYFQEAYRHEKFYDPNDPQIEIIGVQGSRMTVKVATENPTIDQDILHFYDTLQKDGELIGERYRILKRLLVEMGY